MPTPLSIVQGSEKALPAALLAIAAKLVGNKFLAAPKREVVVMDAEKAVELDDEEEDESVVVEAEG